MQCERGVHTVEHAFLDHRRGTAKPLLPRLEHEADSPGQSLALPSEHACRPNEHRDVSIVAAGVGPIRVLRRERLAGLLGHRERIGVGPQQDRRPIRPAHQVGDQTLFDKLAVGKAVDFEFMQADKGYVVTGVK